MTKYRFGKHPPRKDYRTLLMRNYTSALPAPADKYNVLDVVYKNLGVKDPTTLFPMDGNDQYGDSTIAAAGHAITVYNGLVNTGDEPELQAPAADAPAPALETLRAHGADLT